LIPEYDRCENYILNTNCAVEAHSLRNAFGADSLSTALESSVR
jgi:hypothetical protein